MASTWNDLQTDAYEGMIAETVTIPGHNGDPIRAYYSRPLGEEKRRLPAQFALISKSVSPAGRVWAAAARTLRRS